MRRRARALARPDVQHLARAPALRLPVRRMKRARSAVLRTAPSSLHARLSNPSPLARRVAAERFLTLRRNLTVARNFVGGMAQRISEAKHARKKRKAAQPHHQALHAARGKQGERGRRRGSLCAL